MSHSSILKHVLAAIAIVLYLPIACILAVISLVFFGGIARFKQDMTDLFVEVPVILYGSILDNDETDF